MRTYKCLSVNHFKNGPYSLIPIRDEDKFEIMKWRNEQIYHLRQTKPLTEDIQGQYFREVIAPLFDKNKPDQIIFSFLYNNICVGYGGLVHINWLDSNAEISFVMNTNLEREYFKKYWLIYLGLIEKVAFDVINLKKIYTYAYDLRPHLYPIFEYCGFYKEATLVKHKKIDNSYVDIIIHSKINQND
jgi:RimJ/RimL family protein N-acetyltransferase